jgi:outer membrane lipoprotein-sorting protein
VTVAGLCLCAAAYGGDGDGAKPVAPAADEKTPAADGKAPAAEQKTPAADAAAVAKMPPEERSRRLGVAMKGLADALAAVKTVRAKFVQTKRLEVFGRDVESKGTLALRVPDMFRWETTEPVRSELVVHGAAGVRRRTSRKGETTETAFELAKDPVTAATVQQVFLWTTGNFAKASASYALDLVSEAPLVVRARPSDERMAKVVASIEVEFGGSPVHLARVTLTEQTGSRSVIAFSDVEHDPDLPADLFSLERRSEKPR